ncbi:MAG: asparaginase [Aeromicrobium sp.]|uniref:asparaginase n=1 Tax=Aeromicrobium sp. TaxID=1871063 RepID=UPI0039E53495
MELLAEVERSGLVESRHYGLAVAVGPDGDVRDAVGDPETVVFGRSANKPVQAMGMLAAGLGLAGEQLALAAASHMGEERQTAVVSSILADVGLDESALRCPEAYPDDGREHARVLRAGGRKSRLTMGCSGKHAAMLATCVHAGWPIEDYLDPAHPLQRQIAATFAELTGAEASATGVDGCGAPVLATTLRRLAWAVGRIARADTPASAALVAAVRAHPELVSGVRRSERHLVTGLPGALAKSGAEGLMVVGLPDGSGFAVKVADGTERPLYVATARLLERSGHVVAIPDGAPAVTGGGRVVGEVRAAF